LANANRRLDALSTTATKEERLDDLGQFIGGLASGKMSAHQMEIFERSRRMVLETPGYADYYRENLIEWNKIATKDGPAWSNFVKKRAKVVTTLAFLQTPESVEALAGLLDCDETRNVPMEGGPLSQLAASALSGMIENPPAKFNPIPWREWRERVASGKQTFQLKGSPVRYNFDGPVAEVAPPHPAARTQFPGTQVEEAAASPGPLDGPRHRHLPMKVGLAVAMAAVVVWAFLELRARDRTPN
jgi:hypothetical protein